MVPSRSREGDEVLFWYSPEHLAGVEAHADGRDWAPSFSPAA